MQAVVAGIAAACVLAGSAEAKRPHSERYQTVMHLKQGLIRGGHGGSPLVGVMFQLEAAAWRHRISPYAIAAISGFESTFGRNGCPSNPRNIWGLGACGAAWHEPYFETWKEAFNYMARFLKRTWPGARTVHDLHGYCTCGGWSAKVAYYMAHFWGKGPSLRY